jgi:hypothetical protein
LQPTLRPKTGPLKAKDDRNAEKPYSYCGTTLILTVDDTFSFFCHADRYGITAVLPRAKDAQSEAR